MSDIGFALNYTNLYELWTGEAWERIGVGIKSVSQAGNEQTDQTAYYDGSGMTSSLITGGQTVLSFSGDRKYGDPAQDYVASLFIAYGEKRRTKLRWTAPDGQVIQADDATIANITPGGGDANAKATFSFDVHINGLPTLEPGDVTSFPTNITAPAVSVAINQYTEVAATVQPSTASKALAYAVEDDAIATVTSDGHVKGISAGETKLSIKSMALPSIAIVISVTVTAT